MQELPVEGRGESGIRSARRAFSSSDPGVRQPLPPPPRNLSTPPPPPQLLLPASLRQPRKPGAAARSCKVLQGAEAGQLGMLSSWGGLGAGCRLASGLPPAPAPIAPTQPRSGAACAPGETGNMALERCSCGGGEEGRVSAAVLTKPPGRQARPAGPSCPVQAGGALAGMRGGTSAPGFAGREDAKRTSVTRDCASVRSAKGWGPTG